MQERPVPSVSVVMPAYNAAKYLREAIDSILAQTYRDFEFIIINDGSTDRTKEIILNYDDPRIVYLENEKNSGICVTLNKGLNAAQGRYIVRMDADDISLPERLAIQVEYMDKHPEIGVCGSDIIVFGEGKEESIFEQIHLSDDCAAGLLFNPCLAHPSVIINNQILKYRNLCYEDSYRGLEDFKLWWEFAKISKIGNINKPLIRYRHHKGQETRNVKASTLLVSNAFRELRYESFGIKLSEKAKEVINEYSYGHYESFGIEEFDVFLNILSQVCKSHEIPILTSRKALKKTCGKALAYVLSQSSKLALHKNQLLTKALFVGVLTPIWYIKYMRAAIKNPSYE